MTFEEFVTKQLIDNGMFDSDVEPIFSALKKDMPQMAGRWHEDTTAYPPIMQNLIWLGLKRQALIWIDANKPLAWNRLLFEPQEVQDAAVAEMKAEEAAKVEAK